MSEWREYILEDIIDKFIDYRGKTPKKTSSGVPLVTAKIVKGGKILEPNEFIAEKDYDNWMTRGLPQIDDIVLTTEAPLGEIALIKDKNIALAQRIITLRGKKKYVHNPFLKYYFQSSQGQYELDSRASGTTVFGIKAAVLRKTPVNLPPLPEQKAIAEVLSSLDDKIDLLHRQNKTLEQMAETLFRQWFMEEAGEDWEEVLLSDLIEIKGGFSYKGKYIGEGSSLLLGMGCVSFNNRFLHTGARLYSGECPISHLVEPGDLVIATRQQSDNMPILGFPAIIPKSYEGKKVIVGTNLYRLINNSEFDNYFFYKLFRSAEYRSHILSCAKGSTVRMITKDAIESYVIRKPPTEIYNNYQSKSVKINNRINNILEQIRTLESLRDTLLPKLMSGEVRIASHG